jgi:signal transduction histidine kinase
MSVTASPELIALCQAQVWQLRQMFGAISVVIYLTEPSTQSSQSTFVPIVSYPEGLEAWPFQWQQDRPVMPLLSSSSLRTSLTEADQAVSTLDPLAVVKPGLVDAESVNAGSLTDATAPLDNAVVTHLAIDSQRQIILPLIYAEGVLGLLVLVRPDRGWHEEERHYLQEVASGIAAGCVLDRRNQWLQQRLRTKQALQGRQSEVFHNLMHQFRNPLTALGTFGKLLLRRLQPEDPNYAIADNILRESHRLRELIADFDETVELGDSDLQADREGNDGMPVVDVPLTALVAAEPSVSVSEFQKTGPEPAVQGDLVGDTVGAGAGELPVRRLPSKGLGRKLILKPEWVSPLVRPLWEVTTIVADERQLKTWLQLSASATAIQADRSALQEVLANLLDNAIKYTPAGAWVWLLAGARRAQAGKFYQGILVGDTGPGIPPEDQVNLFQRYYRGVQAQGAIAGTGLGLAIAADLISQMHGTIEVISPVIETPWVPAEIKQQLTVVDGPGTAFIVWLPEVD